MVAPEILAARPPEIWTPSVLMSEQWLQSTRTFSTFDVCVPTMFVRVMSLICTLLVAAPESLPPL